MTFKALVQVLSLILTDTMEASKNLAVQKTPASQTLNHQINQPFPFRRLPRDIRLMIYPDINNDGDHTAMLLALAGDKELYKEYMEKLGPRILVTGASQGAFKQYKFQRLLEYRHIKLSCSQEMDCIGRLNTLYPTMTGHKITLKNHLQTISLDFELDWLTAESCISFLIVASDCFRKLLVKFPKHTLRAPQDGAVKYSKGSTFIMELNRILGLIGRMERVSPSGLDELWFWEREDGWKMPR